MDANGTTDFTDFHGFILEPRMDANGTTDFTDFHGFILEPRMDANGTTDFTDFHGFILEPRMDANGTTDFTDFHGFILEPKMDAKFYFMTQIHTDYTDLNREWNHGFHGFSRIYFRTTKKSMEPQITLKDTEKILPRMDTRFLIDSRQWLLVVGGWLLVVGCWLLAVS
jgi:hypothetical protein